MHAEFAAAAEKIAASFTSLLPNSDPVRCALVAQFRGEMPVAIPVWHESRMAGAIIGRRSLRGIPVRIGYLKFNLPRLRCLDVVYGGMLTDGSAAAARATVQLLLDELRGLSADCVSIHNLPDTHPLYVVCAQRASYIAPPAVHWRAHLAPHHTTGVLASFSKKHRYNVRRMERLLHERCGGEASLRTFSQVDEVERFCQIAASITSRTYQAALGVGFRNDALTQELLKFEARRGRFRGYVLECGGQPLAHQVGLLYGEVFFLEATSFLPEFRELSVGQTLLVRVLEELCRVGVCWVDFGFGDADYKRTYGSHSWKEATMRLYGSAVRAQFASAIERCAAIPERLARRMFSSSVAARIKRTWRAVAASAHSSPDRDGTREQ